MKTPNLKIESRRQKVFRYYGRGLSQTEIAKVLKVDRGTIVNDLSALKKKIMSKFNKNDLSDVLMKIEANHDITLSELWTLFNNSKQENTKLGCLKQIRDISAEQVSILQKLGVIEKVPEEIVITKQEDMKVIEEAYERAKKLFMAEEKIATNTND